MGNFKLLLSEVFSEIDKLLNTNYSHSAPKQKQNIIERIFDVISGIFTPILPAIVGAGLLKGVLALLVALSILSDKSSTYEVCILYLMRHFIFYHF